MKPIITLILATLLLASAPVVGGTSPAFAGDVTVLAETDYFPATLNAITHAKSDITMSMYLIQIDPNDTADPAYKLTNALADAAKRGVAVKVVLENDKYKDNMNAYNMLRDAGAAVYFDDPYGFVHDKIIVIDRSVSIVGSHNWDKLALSGNHDTSILIRSTKTADELLAHISSIRLTQPFDTPSTSSGLRLPVSFFKGKDNPCAKLFGNRGDVLFDLYLVLLRESRHPEPFAQRHPERSEGSAFAQDKLREGSTLVVNAQSDPSASGLRMTSHEGYAFTAEYERLGKAIGLDREKAKDKITTKSYNYYYRSNVANFLGMLRDGYGLIKFDRAKNTIEMRGARWEMREGEECIVIPNEYWTYGWDKRLTFPAKYFYLVSLNESRDATDPIWWKITEKSIINRYGMNTLSIKKAVAELQRYDIIDIFRETARKRDLLWFKPPNRYLLKALYDPMVLKRSFLKLKQKYGVKITEQAMGLAEELNTPNNLPDVETFIELIDQYGYDKVREANSKTMALGPGNPKRHIGYTITVLEEKKS